MSGLSTSSATTSTHAAVGGRDDRKRQPVAGQAPSSHAVRVLCVEDHPLVVDGLAVQFAIDGTLEVAGRLISADALVAEARRLAPHVVLLDIEMPGADAFEMADRLHQALPQIRIVVLSAHARDSFVRSAFNAGASGYFTKSDDVAEIIRGIKQVVISPSGTFILGPTLQRLLGIAASTPPRRPVRPADHAKASGDLPHASTATAPQARAGLRTPLDRITPREREVLRLIGKGLSRVQIAKQLSRSVKTVDGHQERMMKKLGVSARADLMRLAIREGLAQA